MSVCSPGSPATQRVPPGPGQGVEGVVHGMIGVLGGHEHGGGGGDVDLGLAWGPEVRRHGR